MNIQGIEYLLQPVATLFADSLGDMLVPLIVVIVIIVNMIRAFKKFSQSRPGTGEAKPQTDSLSPEAQIRDFLDSLSGETKHQPEREEQAAMPPPVPQTVRRPEIRPAPRKMTYQVSPVPRATVAAVSTVTTLETKPIQPAIVHGTDLRKPVRVAVAVPGLHLRASLMHKLAHRDLLKEAILLREILGPPLALRRQMTRQFQE